MDMKIRGRSLRLALPVLMVAGAWSGAHADDGDHGDGFSGRKGEEKLVLVKTIDVQGAGLGTFDISYVDPSIELYVLADRTNASVDLFDSQNPAFIGRIGGV